MKQVIFLILIILLGNNVFAQQYYFSKRYDFNQSSAEQGATVISTDSGSLVLFNTTNSIGTGGLLQRGLLFLNDTGGVQIYHLDSIPDIYIFTSTGTNLVKLPDRELITGSSIEDTLGQVDATLTRFDSIQHVKWMMAYGDDSFQSGWMARHTKDNGFALTGQTATYDYLGDAMLIKTDSNGSILWQKHYGGSKEDLANAMDTCFDGGYILAGNTKSFGVGTPSNRCGNCYAIKTDSLGNLQWYKTFGGIYGDEFHSCLQSKDSNYVFAGHYVNLDPYYPNCNVGSIQCMPFIVKLDTAGNTVWAKTYGAISHNITLWSIKELPNGDLIGAGIYDTVGLSQDGFRGLIVKVNSNGDSLWYLTYNGCQGNESDSYLYDIAPANDRGFVATGWVYPKPPDTGNQDIWVLKIDSNGCEVANCLVSSTGELINYTNGLSVFPNPSSGLFYISHNYYEIETTEVYNYIGERVFSQKGNIEQMDLSNATSGVYFYRISTNKGKIFKGKIVKE